MLWHLLWITLIVVIYNYPHHEDEAMTMSVKKTKLKKKNGKKTQLNILGVNPSIQKKVAFSLSIRV